MLIVVDRIDLDTQITGTFNAADVPTWFPPTAAGNFTGRLVWLRHTAEQSGVLQELLQLARDTVAAEKQTGQKPREEQGKAALTELFEALQDDGTPVIVENIVSRIDEVVRSVRFTGWQSTIEGDRLVQQALRKTLYVQFKIPNPDVGRLRKRSPDGAGAAAVTRGG